MKFGARLLGLGLVTLGAACSASPADDAGQDNAEINEGGLKLCAAVRGNGTYAVTHFASLARIVEHYGVIDGMAGGSSGSITTFLYDSIRKNPAIADCGGETCSPDKLAARVSLALKSVEGYGTTVAGSDEGIAVANLVKVGMKLKQEVEARGIESLAESDVAAAAAQLKAVLAIPEVQGLINPEAIAMLEDTEHLEFNVNELTMSITNLGKFSVDDNRLFFRTGIINWSTLSLLIGRVADFYAGYAPADNTATSGWLDARADVSVGKPWSEVMSVPLAGSEATCGTAFMKLAADYRAKARSTNAVSKRLSERVGEGSSVRKLISTSVLQGDAVPAYETALAAYRSGAHPTGSIPFAPSFDDIKFGYWGAVADTSAVLASSSDDLKSKKAIALGNATWSDILQASPAEPGLSRFTQLADGQISAGGWSDLAPTLVLESMGCERIIYVTRQGDESEFATKIAKHLGMDEASWKALYDLGDPDSSYARSVKAADGVWCTNWNSFTDAQQREMSAESWSAPLETRASFEGIATISPYDNTTERTGKPGCTPGVSGGAQYPR